MVYCERGHSVHPWTGLASGLVSGPSEMAIWNPARGLRRNVSLKPCVKAGRTAAEKHCNTMTYRGMNSETLKKDKWWIGKALGTLPSTRVLFYFQMYHIIGKRHGSVMFLLEKLESNVILRNSICRCSPDINKCFTINCMRVSFYSKYFILWFIHHLFCCLSTF